MTPPASDDNPPDQPVRNPMIREEHSIRDGGVCSENDVEPGDVLGEFKLLRRIGRGGQGEVWEAYQQSLGRRVALKLVLPERINKRSLELFALEARAGGRQAHPGIVAVHGFGEDNGRHWIAQELIVGARTLRDFIDESRKLDVLPENYHRAAALFVAELADALQAAHDAGVVHQDVKPENVLVTKDNHPKLTDFGLALIEEESTPSTSEGMAGTWFYMSPEQLENKRDALDHRSDIFSLGVVLYEMLALVRPFQGDTSHQVAQCILQREAPDLRKMRSRVPQDLAVICAKALEKARESRFQSMREFAADLRRYLVHEPIQSRPAGILERTRKWIRRNPNKSIGGAVGVTALTVVSVLALQILDQQTRLKSQQGTLTTSNEGLLRVNSALEERKVEALLLADAARQASHDAELHAASAQGLAEDALRLSLSQDYDDLVLEAENLWPPSPEQVPLMEAWQKRAEALLSELPALRAKQAALRNQARPRTEEGIRLEREAHVEYPQLVALGAKIRAKQQLLAVREGAEPAPLPEVQPELYPSKASALNSLAWPMVDPDRELYGKEALGLVLIRRAVDFASDEERAGILDSLAWACFALGDDEEAVAISQEALELAPETQHAAFAGYLQKLEGAIKLANSPDGKRGARDEIVQLIANQEELEMRVSTRATWTFPDSLEQQSRPSWWHHTVTGVINSVESLQEASTGLASPSALHPVQGWSIPRRLNLAKRMRVGFSPGGEYWERWQDSAPELESVYPGIKLPIQTGLVPIGVDPESGLLEFWHVYSGEEPQRDSKGALLIEEGSGIVLVLLPGGQFWMGAQATQASEPNFDPSATALEFPVHQVELSAFFLSKYELNQGQWKRLTGLNPSADGPDGQYFSWWNSDQLPPTLLEPVERVSLLQANVVLTRFGLQLPSEAQWEYGARAGTSTVWWTGNSKDDLQGAVNLADVYAKEHGGSSWRVIDDWLDDGYTSHAPVNTLLANPFGLHHMHGNVWEWCADTFNKAFYEESSGVDPVCQQDSQFGHVARGGSFSNVHTQVRSADRLVVPAAVHDKMLGLRAARPILRVAHESLPVQDR